MAVCLGFALPAVFYERTDLLSDGTLPTTPRELERDQCLGVGVVAHGTVLDRQRSYGTSSIVLADGSAFAPDVAVPADRTGHPTGLVFHGGDGFEVSENGVEAPRPLHLRHARGPRDRLEP
jgi:hypothetical protein